jgi:hypothetical protein
MRKRDDIVVALLTLADIIVLIVMYPLLPRAIETLVVLCFLMPSLLQSWRFISTQG